VQHHAHIQVIEIDRDLAARLRTGPCPNQLTVHEGDVLKFDWASLPGPLRVVGNLPYNISSPILFGLLPHADVVIDQHFMLQKEVVDRMVAKAGTADYGRLSVMLQAYYTMESVLDVPPECFDPPPKVQSAIVRMVPKPLAERQAIAADWFSRLVAAAFSQRRKMLRNNWAELVPQAYTEKLGINLQSRAQELEPAQYLALAGLMAQAT
jgi:16S rRNA (adenine1518-N6/adenine1519-N6)-dimethyltransferase